MNVDQIVDGLIETLASIEHQRWARWQAHLHGKSIKQADGSLTIPAHLVERWQRQMGTPYEQLSETEKDSDREQVREYLSVIRDALRG